MEQTYLDARQALPDESELMDLPEGLSYLVKPRRPKAGIVLIHDWLQTPASMRKLADYLQNQGFLVIVPRLPGHATTAADLENRTFDEWQIAVDEAYAYAMLTCAKVVVCGVGNSVALAISLAARGYEMAALAALFPALSGVSQILPEPESESANENRKTGAFYPGAPVASERQVKKMLVQAVKNLPAVTTPVLLLHNDAISKNEHQSLQKYFAKVESSEKELLLLPVANPTALTRKDNHSGQALVDFIKRNL
jgi:carboxylesterase